MKGILLVVLAAMAAAVARGQVDVAEVKANVELALQSTQGVVYGVQPKVAMSGEWAYNEGQRRLDERKWEAAAEAFEKVAKGEKVDAALYWKAYAQHKLGRRDQALATLGKLKQEFANSRWLGDARALEVEVRQASGQTVSPESETDDEVKLLAVQGVMRNDPEKGLAVLQKMMSGPQAPRVKERALFVLGQSDSPKAQELILQLAKGGGNPDVQRTAIRMLGMRGKENQKLLMELYQSGSDVQMKKEALRALLMASAKERLAEIAKTEKDVVLKKEAIRQVGASGQAAVLMELYKGESNAEMRGEIANGLAMSGATTQLLELVGVEKDAAVRRRLVTSLAMQGKEKTGAALRQLYQKEADKETRTALLRAFTMQGDVGALIEVAKTEKDAELKKEAVRGLSRMKSKEASDYLVELLSK